MTVPSLFKEYIWLVNTIKRARRITFAEIQEKWLDTEMSGGVEFARSTFNRHKDAIQDIFGIYIDCDRKGGYKYYIGNENVLHEDTVQNWIVSTMSVNDVISDSKALHDRIVLQQIPCDDYLQTFINAMKKKVRVAVKYRRYESDNITEVDFEPYCLKLFNQRWYVLAHFHRDATPEKEERDYYGVYSFDRIQEISLTDVKFEVREDFDAQEYFSECFGVVPEMALQLNASSYVHTANNVTISMICLCIIARKPSVRVRTIPTLSITSVQPMTSVVIS